MGCRYDRTPTHRGIHATIHKTNEAIQENKTPCARNIYKIRHKNTAKSPKKLDTYAQQQRQHMNTKKIQYDVTKRRMGIRKQIQMHIRKHAPYKDTRPTPDWSGPKRRWIKEEECARLQEMAKTRQKKQLKIGKLDKRTLIH